MAGQDIHQETSEGQFEDPISQQQTREVDDLSWADHVIDDAHLGVEPGKIFMASFLCETGRKLVVVQ